MANYISSNANRFYVAVETAYGQAATVSSGNRFPAVRLEAQQSLEHGRRLDKTGTRTYLGTPLTARRQTAFETRTYLTSWSGIGTPSYGPLFQAAMGGIPVSSSGLSVASVQNNTQIQTTMAHGLSFGSAISFGGEIRFVVTVIDAETVLLNAPFSNTPPANASLSACVTYPLAIGLPSVTLHDYWDPATAVSRLITGAAVNSFTMSVDGDFHEFVFSGPACDLLDSSSFVAGDGGLSSFPTEPTLTKFDYSIVPGHLGQAWLGSTPNQFFTLTGASVELKNNIDVRNQEFGSSYPRAIAAGMRQVASTFTLFAQDDEQTTALYAAAKQRTPVTAMLQLGQQTGQVMGLFIPNVTPEIPTFDDGLTRLQWSFKNNLAQGTAENELYIAFA
ncbi:MAG: hypothetical protein JO340_21335 [Acidobacteriaceae bacterium]|nr:hypothetical protein [Acidobacteriaceae bacterium]